MAIRASRRVIGPPDRSAVFGKFDVFLGSPIKLALQQGGRIRNVTRGSVHGGHMRDLAKRIASLDYCLIATGISLSIIMVLIGFFARI